MFSVIPDIPENRNRRLLRRAKQGQNGMMGRLAAGLILPREARWRETGTHPPSLRAQRSNLDCLRGKTLDCFRLRRGFGGQVAALAMTRMRAHALNSGVVLAKARTHYPGKWFGEGWLFGTDIAGNR